MRADDQAQIFDKLKMNDAMIVQFFLPKYIVLYLTFLKGRRGLIDYFTSLPPLIKWAIKYTNNYHHLHCTAFLVGSFSNK